MGEQARDGDDQLRSLERAQHALQREHAAFETRLSATERMVSTMRQTFDELHLQDTGPRERGVFAEMLTWFLNRKLGQQLRELRELRLGRIIGIAAGVSSLVSAGIVVGAYFLTHFGH